MDVVAVPPSGQQGSPFGTTSGEDRWILVELILGPLITAVDSNVAPDHLIDSRDLICGFWFPQFVSQPSHELVK